MFSKCFHGPKREPKKPLNKGLQGDFVLFELYRPRWLTRQVIHNTIDPAHLIDNSGHHLI